jgi:hypothetical protein
MSDEVSKKAIQAALHGVLPQDNFGWEPDMASTGGEVDRPVRSMQGEVTLKFVDPDWSANGVNCNGRELICYDKSYEVMRWNDNNRPQETIPLIRGAPCPDLKAMNAAIPQAQWRTGLDGNPEPPYQLRRVLEFLDPKNMERLSWPHKVTVVGSTRAAEELEGRIKIARRVCGKNVCPVAKLTHTFMPTRFGGQERPYLAIVYWVCLGEHGIERVEINVTPQAQLQRGTEQPASPTQSAPKVTTAEELNDDIPWK